MDSFRDVINKWSSPVELAGDMGERIDTVRKWYYRDKIPSGKWVALIASAKKRRIMVSVQLLASLSSKRIRPTSSK